MTNERLFRDLVVMTIFLAACWLIMVVGVMQLMFYAEQAFGHALWIVVAGEAILIGSTALMYYLGWRIWQERLDG